MSKLVPVVGLVALCIVLLICLRESDPTKTDYARLEGTWVLVGQETRGRPYSAEDLDKQATAWIIRDRELVEWREDRYGRPKKSGLYRIQLDPSTTPRHIDFIDTNGQVNHAIYSLDRDGLIVCVSQSMMENEPEERPIRFTSIEKENNDLPALSVYRFKRDRNGNLNVIGRPERRRQHVPSSANK